MMALIKENEYVETYKPLIGWFVSVVLAALLLGFERDRLGSGLLMGQTLKLPGILIHKEERHMHGNF